MIRAFRELHRIQQGFEAAERVLEQTIGVSTCMSGCGKCCQKNVPYWRTIEAINAVSVLMGTGKLKKAVSLAEGWLLEHHKEAKAYEGMSNGLASPRIHQEWLDLRQTTCPFLDDSMSCVMHFCRSLSCRAYGVTYAPVSDCPRPPGKGETLSQHKYASAEGLRRVVHAYWDDCKQRKPEWIVSGFVPTLLYRAAEPDKFKKMVLDNQIASAKIIGVDYEVSLMWQPELEALESGVSPDLVAAGIYKNNI